MNTRTLTADDIPKLHAEINIYIKRDDMHGCGYSRRTQSSGWNADPLLYSDHLYHNGSSRIHSKAPAYRALGILAAGWPMALAVFMVQANTISVLSVPCMS